MEVPELYKLIKTTWLAALAFAIFSGCAAPGLATPSASDPTSTAAPLPASSTPEVVLETTSAPVPTATTANEPTPGETPAAAACTSPAALTPELTEGPYFTPNSPEKTTLVEPGISGTRLLLTGTS